MFALLPIIGSGTRRDPYRADVPTGVPAYSSHIPTDETGVPIYLDAPVWFDVDLMIPSSVVTRLRTEETVRRLFARRDPMLNVAQMKRPPQVRDLQMATRTILADDNFNRADNTDLGAAWDAGYTGATNAQIVNNRVRPSVLFTDCAESYNAVALPNDQWGQCTIATIAGTVGNAPRICLRMANPASFTFYEYTAFKNVPAKQSRLAKWITGAFTELAFENVTTWSNGDVLYADAVGTALELHRNGNQTALLTATDSAITSGRAGLIVNLDTGGNLADCEIDDWQAGGFTTPSAATPYHMLYGPRVPLFT